MANEKNDISDIVKKCKILLLDIEGTTTSISFVKDKLFPYAEENVKDFLDKEWESEDVKEAVTALRKLALEDEEKKIDGVITIPAEDASKDKQIEGLVNSVKWQMSSDRKVGPLKQLQGLIWKKGYDKGDIKGHVYDDVSPALELWRSVEGQKVYIYSSGSVQAQKLLFGMSSAGDILKLIDGHFDTAVGAKQDAASYTAIAKKIGCKAEEILFLTDIDKEAEAARLAGVQAALVSREGNAPLPEAVTSAYPVLYSFTELAATKKRKPDAQDEQQPAKVPKTDVETGVKTPVETILPTTTPPENKSEEIEEMEVEEETATKEEKAAGKLTDEAAEQIETTVEDITGSKEVADITVSDAKPIIIESPETKKMETECLGVVNSVSDSKAKGDKNASEPKETLPVVITEIKDITNDKESVSEVTEIIEDLVPIVEEPVAKDMEDLQNAGDVLEKECDEILSKVQDVTNLDLPLKPLHPIAEESMETENMDTNDIVEGILDTEQELEMKKCTDSDLKSVQDICAAKATADSDKSETQVVTKPSEVVSEEKPLKSTVKEAKTTEEVKEKQATLDARSPTDEKIKESSLTEEKVKETSLIEEKVKETNLKEEKVEKTSLTEEKVNDTSLTEEKVKETSLAEEVKEASLTEEKVKGTSLAEEKVKETSLAEEKVKETSLTEEKLKGTSLAEEKVKETSLTKEKVKETSLTEEKAKESNKTEKNVNENRQTEEKVKESSQVEKKDSNLSEERVSKSCDTDEKVKDNSVIDEQVKEKSITEESKESSITKEKVKDISSLEQKVEDSSSVEGKPEENKAIVDVVKSAEEKVDTKMDTDLSTPETDDSRIMADEKKTEDKSENKSETEEMQVEDEKSDAHSNKLPAETNTKKLTEESSMDIDQTETKAETKVSEKVATVTTETAGQPENDSKETQVNGKATNGDADMVDLNGDASKDDELSSRLSMENGKEVVNGANGDSTVEAKSENNGDDVKEVTDIKVKTVAMDEPRNDPIEQPTEA